MSNLIKADQEYNLWVKDIKKRYQQSQIKAAVQVNSELLKFYWSLGRDIINLHAENRWGTHFFENLSQDIKSMIPDVKGFSTTNLRYMKRYYQLFPDVDEKLIGENVAQVGAEIYKIPWGHVKCIINKCRNNPLKAIFYVHKTIEHNWSRAILMNFLDTDLYERQGKALSNFSFSLPKEQSDLAQQITKDPYNFDFLTIREGYNEKELKDALMDNIQKFLLELGTGFAFVGREYRIVIGSSEEFIDMLFYNIRLHCYVVVEVKVVEFKPADIGQLGTYVAAVNHILKGKDDAEVWDAGCGI